MTSEISAIISAGVFRVENEGTVSPEKIQLPSWTIKIFRLQFTVFPSNKKYRLYPVRFELKSDSFPFNPIVGIAVPQQMYDGKIFPGMYLCDMWVNIPLSASPAIIEYSAFPVIPHKKIPMANISIYISNKMEPIK